MAKTKFYFEMPKIIHPLIAAVSPFIAKVHVVSRFFITTPIYYVNDVPHLGHAYTMVSTDSIARWRRLRGEEVFYLTGTDEHGLKIAQAAAENGMSPKQWTDLLSPRFQDAWRKLNISYDDFIRTTETRHYETVQAFLSSVYENGYIYKDIYRGLYCISCEAYYQESELSDGNCPIHNRPVTVMEEENYFFRLSAFTDRLLEWYEKSPNAVRPPSKRNEALGFIRQGLQDISITRTSIDWGVPVPWDDQHVFYVWYDALINYLTAIDYGRDADRFSAWWPSVHHVIGKDIIRFHCVWWPAMCMAAGIDPPANIFVHGWLLVGGEKMAKSAGNKVDPLELVEDFGLDAVRYYLLRDTNFGSDGDFTYEALTARYNSDLANNLGNLLQRVTTVVANKLDGHAPQPASDSPLALFATHALNRAEASWNEFAPQDALEAVWSLIHETNARLEVVAPWKLEPGEELDSVLGDALECLRLVCITIYPVMPDTSCEVWTRIGLAGSPNDQGALSSLTWGLYRSAGTIEKGTPLFPRRK